MGLAGEGSNWGDPAGKGSGRGGLAGERSDRGGPAGEGSADPAGLASPAGESFGLTRQRLPHPPAPACEAKR